MQNRRSFNSRGSMNRTGPGMPFGPPEINMEPPDKSFTSATFFDIPYAAQSEAQKLDIYLPSRGDKPYPVIVRFHGGGFLIGDKKMDIARSAEPMLANGYAVVDVGYRLSSEAIFPAQIYDAKAAIRWTRANALKYSLNPDKIVAWGDSAGAFLAALLGTSSGVKELEDLTMGNPDQSSRVDAVVDWFGPIDFLKMDEHHKQLGQKGQHNEEDSAESRLIGGQLTRFPERCSAASPLTYIRADCPPFYIQHGKADDAVPYLQSIMLAEALRAVIGEDKVELELIENAGHLAPEHWAPERLKKLFDFLDKN